VSATIWTPRSGETNRPAVTPRSKEPSTDAGEKRGVVMMRAASPKTTPTMGRAWLRSTTSRSSTPSAPRFVGSQWISLSRPSTSWPRGLLIVTGAPTIASRVPNRTAIRSPAGVPSIIAASPRRSPSKSPATRLVIGTDVDARYTFGIRPPRTMSTSDSPPRAATTSSAPSPFVSTVTAACHGTFVGGATRRYVPAASPPQGSAVTPHAW